SRNRSSFALYQDLILDAPAKGANVRHKRSSAHGKLRGSGKFRSRILMSLRCELRLWPVNVTLPMAAWDGVFARHETAYPSPARTHVRPRPQGSGAARTVHARKLSGSEQLLFFAVALRHLTAAQRPGAASGRARP